MGNVLDKVRQFRANKTYSGHDHRVRGIFHQWKDGDNIIRLVGEFIEVRTHFIAPVKNRNDRGLCRDDAFEGDDALPQVINCPNWDIEMEKPRKQKTCPICVLNELAWAALKENPTPEEKKFLESLRIASAPRRNVKWNIIDRADPFVIVTENGQERRVLGLKIATIGMEAYNDIEAIFEQCGFDITDPDAGIDIRVVKGFNGTRTVYTAQACVEGLNLKQTPLTEEERALALHDLKAICGRAVDIDKLMDALHEDLRQLIEVNRTPNKDLAAEEDAADIQIEESVCDQEEAKTEVVVPRVAPSVPKSIPSVPRQVTTQTPVSAPAKPVAAPAKPAVKMPTKPASVSAPSPAKHVVKMPTMPISKPAPVVAQAVEEAIEEAEVGDRFVDKCKSPVPIPKNFACFDTDEYEFSTSVDPESFVCFGTAEPGHPECEKCSFREPCAKKTDEKKAGM